VKRVHQLTCLVKLRRANCLYSSLCNPYTAPTYCFTAIAVPYTAVLALYSMAFRFMRARLPISDLPITGYRSPATLPIAIGNRSPPGSLLILISSPLISSGACLISQGPLLILTFAWLISPASPLISRAAPVTSLGACIISGTSRLISPGSPVISTFACLTSRTSLPPRQGPLLTLTFACLIS